MFSEKKVSYSYKDLLIYGRNTPPDFILSNAKPYNYQICQYILEFWNNVKGFSLRKDRVLLNYTSISKEVLGLSMAYLRG